MASSIFAAHQRTRTTGASNPNLSTPPQNIVGSGDLNMILLDANVSASVSLPSFSYAGCFLGRQDGHRCRGYSTSLHGFQIGGPARNAQGKGTSFAFPTESPSPFDLDGCAGLVSAGASAASVSKYELMFMALFFFVYIVVLSFDFDSDCNRTRLIGR